MKLRPAGFAEPHESVKFAVATLALDDQSNRVGRALRRMRNPRGKQKHFALLDMDVFGLSIIDDLDSNVAFDLIKQLFTFVVVVILARVWTPNDHHNEFRVLVDRSIANRRFQEIAVLVDPRLQVERW